jgi:hypothetical protein
MKKENLKNPLEDFPKLLFKKNFEEFKKRELEDKLTKEDMDDWIELFESFIEFVKRENLSIK